jgi:hypothetical protein
MLAPPWGPGVRRFTEESEMVSQRYTPCIEACNRCAAACNHCAASCLREPDVASMARCIALDVDCAAMCLFAAGAMARDSEFARAVCGLCADVCESCADECARHPMDHCRDCAAACRDCAEQCRRMAAAAPNPSPPGARLLAD